MKDKAFLDTNILVYCFDERDLQKQQVARELVKTLVKTKRGRISTQSLQEFYNVVTKRLKCDKNAARLDVERYAKMFPVNNNTPKDILRAISINIQTQFTIYDSLIIAAAIAEGCEVVYSEDLNDGQSVDGVQIVNPFK